MSFSFDLRSLQRALQALFDSWWTLALTSERKWTGSCSFFWNSWTGPNSKEPYPLLCCKYWLLCSLQSCLYE